MSSHATSLGTFVYSCLSFLSSHELRAETDVHELINTLKKKKKQMWGIIGRTFPYNPHMSVKATTLAAACQVDELGDKFLVHFCVKPTRFDEHVGYVKVVAVDSCMHNGVTISSQHGQVCATLQQ